jgi:hypothetical protein
MVFSPTVGQLSSYHPMRRSLFVSIITSVTLAPAIALAAFTLPSQVLMSVQFDGKPMDIAFEAHGHMEDMDVSAWISGQSQNHKDIKSAKAALKATVDMQKEGEGRMRIKAEMKVVDAKGYFRLVSIEGAFQDELGDIATQFSSNKWYSVDLDEAAEETPVGLYSEEEMTELLSSFIDRLFSLQKTKSGTDTVYSIKLKRQAWKEFSVLLKETGMDDGIIPSKKDLNELRKIFSKINVHIKVTTDASDVAKSLKLYAAYKDKDLSVALQGTSTVRSSPVQVTAPLDAIPLEEATKSSTSERLEDAKTAVRQSDVDSILTAIYQYAIDNNGNLPAGIPFNTPAEICQPRGGDCTGYVNLNILTESYLVRIPSDPENAKDDKGTGYLISQDTPRKI